MAVTMMRSVEHSTCTSSLPDVIWPPPATDCTVIALCAVLIYTLRHPWSHSPAAAVAVSSGTQQQQIAKMLQTKSHAAARIATIAARNVGLIALQFQFTSLQCSTKATVGAADSEKVPVRLPNVKKGRGVVGTDYMMPDFGSPAAKRPVKIELEAGKTYAWCACGRSAKQVGKWDQAGSSFALQPFCDGSHAHLGMPLVKPVRVKFDTPTTVSFCMCKQTLNRPYCDGSHKMLGLERVSRIMSWKISPFSVGPAVERPAVALQARRARARRQGRRRRTRPEAEEGLLLLIGKQTRVALFFVDRIAFVIAECSKPSSI